MLLNLPARAAKSKASAPPATLHVVNEVVDHGLCVRCGMCLPACPYDILGLDQRLYPKMLDEAKCPTQCDACLRVCPGLEVNYPQLSNQLFGTVPDPLSVTGVARRLLAAYSTDPVIRESGSSGGVVSQLLVWMLEKGYIQGALVVKNDFSTNAQSTPFIATTREQILGSCGSKYTIIPVDMAFDLVFKTPGRIAMVGVPCHIHAVRKYQQIRKSLNDKLPLIIGLACHMAFEPECLEDLLAKNKIPERQVRSVSFRSGKWPGGIQATLEGGKKQNLHQSDVKSGAYNYLARLYYPERCLTCTDFSAELADLMVSDPWMRNEQGDYLFKDSRSLVLLRSEKAERLFMEAVADGVLEYVELPLSMFNEQFGAFVRHKKVHAPMRVEQLKRRGERYPEYHIEYPDPTPAQRRQLAWDQFTRILGKSRFGQKLGVTLAFSWPGVLFGKLREIQKKRNYVKRVRKNKNGDRHRISSS
jgi:coenzyme F420 hydrogenase subunit beta